MITLYIQRSLKNVREVKMCLFKVSWQSSMTMGSKIRKESKIIVAKLDLFQCPDVRRYANQMSGL